MKIETNVTYGFDTFNFETICTPDKLSATLDLMKNQIETEISAKQVFKDIKHEIARLYSISLKPTCLICTPEVANLIKTLIPYSDIPVGQAARFLDLPVIISDIPTRFYIGV